MAGVPTRLSSSILGMRGSSLFIYDPSDANPFFFVTDASGGVIGTGINMWALLDSTTGLIAGTAVAAGTTGATIITASSANALAVGRQGTTSPALNVATSASNSVTGLSVVAAASGAGLALALIGGAAAENLTLDAKGSGTLTLQGTATGAIALARATGVTGALTVTSAAATALTVGRQGATNPALVVDAATASSLTGLKLTAAGTGAGLAVAVVEAGGTNNNLTLDAMGSGTVTINGTATGAIALARNTGITGTATVTSAAAAALAVGRQGATNPALVVDASTSSALTGLKLTAAGTGAGVALAAVETGGTNNSLTIDAMGSGTTTLNGTATGNVVVGTALAFGTDASAAKSIVVGTTNGLKIGTAASQKLGFFNATPVVQQTKAGHNNWAAFTDVVAALVSLGLFDQA